MGNEVKEDKPSICSESLGYGSRNRDGGGAGGY